MCYKSKMQNAKNRNIEFLLTEEEYNLLYSIGRDHLGRCAYTNQKFSTKFPSHHRCLLANLIQSSRQRLSKKLLTC